MPGTRRNPPYPDVDKVPRLVDVPIAGTRFAHTDLRLLPIRDARDFGSAAMRVRAQALDAWAAAHGGFPESIDPRSAIGYAIHQPREPLNIVGVAFLEEISVTEDTVSALTVSGTLRLLGLRSADELATRAYFDGMAVSAEDESGAERLLTTVVVSG